MVLGTARCSLPALAMAPFPFLFRSPVAKGVFVRMGTGWSVVLVRGPCLELSLELSPIFYPPRFLAALPGDPITAAAGGDVTCLVGGDSRARIAKPSDKTWGPEDSAGCTKYPVLITLIWEGGQANSTPGAKSLLLSPMTGKVK